MPPVFQRLERAWFEFIELAGAARLERRVAKRLTALGDVRIAFVKQDVQDDLYCCARGSNAAEIVLSTLMRSGPVALFTRLGAEFLIVETESDPECQAWAEKAVDLGWYDWDSLRNLRNIVPGRDHGQSAFAVRCEAVDWSDFDIVISLDVSIPARITRGFPQTLWCYYIREPKTKSYTRSQQAPLPGQDVFLNQTFGSRRREHARHSLCVPYYLHYYGCFHELLERPLDDGTPRTTLFLEHHTPEALTSDQLRQLEGIGPLDSTSRPSAGEGPFAPPNQKCQRSPREVLSALLGAKYFIACPHHRKLWANAAVEAIAAGALVLGDPQIHIHRDLFSPRTSISSFDELSAALVFLERNPAVYLAEVRRQRRIVDYLCYWRPVRDLLQTLCEHRRQ